LTVLKSTGLPFPLILQLAMVPEGTQSGVLQQLGVSYAQLVDYSSKDYIATLVRSVNDLLTFTQIDVGSILHSGTGNMELHHHSVCTLERFNLNIIDAYKVIVKYPSSGKLKDARVGQPYG